MSRRGDAPLGSPGDLACKIERDDERQPNHAVRRIRTTIGKETTLDVNESGA